MGLVSSYKELTSDFQTQLKKVTGYWPDTIKGKTKDEKEEKLAKKCAKLLDVILDKTKWKKDVETYNLVGKLYQKMSKTKLRRKATDDKLKSIVKRMKQFDTKPMPKNIIKLEKKDKHHLSGTHQQQLIDKGKSEEQAKKEVSPVAYFRSDIKMKHCVTFDEKGRMELPKYLKGAKDVMYVMDALGNFYVAKEIAIDGKKIKHSSFFRGEPVAGSGSLELGSDGTIKKVDNHSGHYEPTKKELENVKHALKLHGVSVNKLEVKYYKN